MNNFAKQGRNMVFSRLESDARFVGKNHLEIVWIKFAVVILVLIDTGQEVVVALSRSTAERNEGV